MYIGHFPVLDFGKMFHLHKRLHQSFLLPYQSGLHLGIIHHDQYNKLFPLLVELKMEYNQTQHHLSAPIFHLCERLLGRCYHHNNQIEHILIWVYFYDKHRLGKLDLAHIVLDILELILSYQVPNCISCDHHRRYWYHQY